LLGYCDSTGFSAGDHLHFELKAVLKNTERFYNVFQTNGYYGGVNPDPYWNGEYAKPIIQVPLTRDLYLGCSGVDVVYLQNLLIKKGFMEEFPETKGYFGPKTREGVKKLQIKYGLSPLLGYCGPKTRMVLGVLAGE